MLKNKLILSIAAVLSAASISSLVAAVEIDPNDPDCKIENDPLNGGSAAISIEAPVSGSIGDLDVIIDVDSPFIGDLVFTLNHGATTITLMDKVPNQTGACNIDVDVGFTLDDEAGSSVQAQCADLNSGGPWSPKDALSAFDGQEISGTWTMTVTDTVAEDSHAFQGWCLKSDVGSATLPCDLDGDGDSDFSDLSLFEDAFFAQDLSGDLDNDGDVDFSDLSLFEDCFMDANGF